MSEGASLQIKALAASVHVPQIPGAPRVSTNLLNFHSDNLPIGRVKLNADLQSTGSGRSGLSGDYAIVVTLHSKTTRHQIDSTSTADGHGKRLLYCEIE